MKDFLLKSSSVFMTVLFLFVQTVAVASPANNSDFISSVDVSVFELDETNLDFVMLELNELGNYLDQNEGVTYDQVALAASELLINVSSTSAPAGGDEAPLGIPSFLWGCVFGVVGILIVYLVTDSDMDETKKALWGCLAGAAVGSVLYFAVFATTTAAAATYY